MRLDVSYLHFISKQELRTLISIELGMRNHQFVPYQVILKLGNLRSGQTFKIVKKLLKNKLIVHVGGKNDGYKLTYLGYDYLALHTFLKRGVLKDVICKIGVGKESDIYKCEDANGNPVVLKLTRLGRRSFKTIKKNREYIQNRTNYNWLYLSRLSSIRQFTFMQVLFEHGFPTPRPIDTNRHAIVMSLIDGDPLCNIRRIGSQCSVKEIFTQSLKMVVKFAEHGLIHGDFNQFNVLISEEGKLTVIDFPQCISSFHLNGKQYFERDVECLYRYFDKMMVKIMKESKQNQNEEDGEGINEKDIGFDVSQIPMPIFEQIEVIKRLDNEVNKKGHIKLSQVTELNKYQQEVKDVEQVKQKDEVEESSEQQMQIEELGEEICEEKIEQVNQKEEAFEKEQNQYDIELKKLILELQEPQIRQKKKIENQSLSSDSESEENEEQEEEVREQWKGLTAYQIRQKIKEEKKEERKKKKQDISTQEYIKKALRKSKKEHQQMSKGNRGVKQKNKDRSQAIKDGMQLMY